MSETQKRVSRVSAPIPVYGSARMLGREVGERLKDCTWVGIPFCGGLSELRWIKAPAIVANDLNVWAINLYQVMQTEGLHDSLKSYLGKSLFHEAELESCQQYLKSLSRTATLRDALKNYLEPSLFPKAELESSRITKLIFASEMPDHRAWYRVEVAAAYFKCLWMSRAGCGLTDGELDGSFSFRWDWGSGGDSLVRYRSAVAALDDFARQFERCQFLNRDAFDFLDQCRINADKPDNGIYCDPPFPGKEGTRYLHNCGETDAEQRLWHTRLRDVVLGFRNATVVMRFYHCELIRELYSEDQWEWSAIAGRDQHNNPKREVLLVRKRD